MSIYRRFSLLVCTLSWLLSCATPTTPVHHPGPTSGPEAIDFEFSPAAPRRARSPYAPTRAHNLPRYSWQSTTEQRCDRKSSPSEPAAPIVLKFSGSVGVFPLLPEPLLEPQSTKPAEALDTWGTAAPPLPESRSPELVVAGLRPGFRHCFSRWSESKADAEGSVRFALELGCTGDVRAISADVQGVDEPTLECLFTVVAPAQFAPPANGRATLQVPVVFKNAAR